MTAPPAPPPPGPARGARGARGWYTWRAPRRPWMHAALAKAEAEHGPPVPTCVCGHRLVTPRHRMYARCPECGQSAYTGTT
jgi:hypothetical protein